MLEDFLSSLVIIGCPVIFKEAKKVIQCKVQCKKVGFSTSVWVVSLVKQR